jgi:hypothetical protein
MFELRDWHELNRICYHSIPIHTNPNQAWITTQFALEAHVELDSILRGAKFVFVQADMDPTTCSSTFTVFSLAQFQVLPVLVLIISNLKRRMFCRADNFTCSNSDYLQSSLTHKPPAYCLCRHNDITCWTVGIGLEKWNVRSSFLCKLSPQQAVEAYRVVRC